MPTRCSAPVRRPRAAGGRSLRRRRAPPLVIDELLAAFSVDGTPAPPKSPPIDLDSPEVAELLASPAAPMRSTDGPHDAGRAVDGASVAPRSATHVEQRHLPSRRHRRTWCPSRRGIRHGGRARKPSARPSGRRSASPNTEDPEEGAEADPQGPTSSSTSRRCEGSPRAAKRSSDVRIITSDDPTVPPVSRVPRRPTPVGRRAVCRPARCRPAGGSTVASAATTCPTRTTSRAVSDPAAVVAARSLDDLHRRGSRATPTSSRSTSPRRHRAWSRGARAAHRGQARRRAARRLKWAAIVAASFSSASPCSPCSAPACSRSTHRRRRRARCTAAVPAFDAVDRRARREPTSCASTPDAAERELEADPVDRGRPRHDRLPERRARSRSASASRRRLPGHRRPATGCSTATAGSRRASTDSRPPTSNARDRRRRGRPRRPAQTAPPGYRAAATLAAGAARRTSAPASCRSRSTADASDLRMLLPTATGRETSKSASAQREDLVDKLVRLQTGLTDPDPSDVPDTS